MAVLHEDVADIKAAMRELAGAITKLALVEERQTRTAESLSRAFKSIERVEERISALEQESSKSQHVSVWVDRGVWAAAAAAVMFAAKKVGLI